MIQRIYFIPAEFKAELVGPEERVHLPPQGWLGVYHEALKVGLKFFLYPFVVELMKAFILTPLQIVPNLW